MGALTRELIEETGIKPTIGNLIYVHQIGQAGGVFGDPGFYFHIKNGEDYLRLDISKTTHGEQELAEIGFVDIKKVAVLPVFLKIELPELQKNKFETPTRFRLSPFK